MLSWIRMLPIENTFPLIVKIYYNASQFSCFAYVWKRAAPNEMQRYMEGTFMGPKIINNHGSLLKMYYSYGDGNPPAGEIEDIYSDKEKIKKNMWGSFTQYDFISEGDSPAYFHLMDVGLDNLENPSFGGWGGRLIQSPSSPNRWEDGDQVMDFNPFTAQMDNAYSQTRWIDVLQNEFAARADWCVSSYAKVELVSQQNISAKPVEKIEFQVKASDPDGNQVDYKWWQYFEVDTYSGKVKLPDLNKKSIEFEIPKDSKPEDNIHIIKEVTDDGSPKLTRYRRTIITVI